MDTIPRFELAPGYTISRVLKGGWQLAGGHGPVEDAAALDDMDRFVEAGVTTFDCADIYTGVETLIGRWLERRKGRAGADVQVHTKYVPDLDRLPMHSRADVVRGVDRSLARLGVERLDLVQLHWWDYSVPGYVEAAVWLEELRRAGKIRHVGLTNFDRQRLSEIVAGGATITSHQVQYSVIDRRPAAGLAAYCAEKGIGLLCYGAVAGGFLSDRYLGSAGSPPAARKPIARQVSADHRRVRRMGSFPGAARRARADRFASPDDDRRRGHPMGPRSARRLGRDRRRATCAPPRPDPESLRASSGRHGSPDDCARPVGVTRSGWRRLRPRACERRTARVDHAVYARESVLIS